MADETSHPEPIGAGAKDGEPPSGGGVLGGMRQEPDTNTDQDALEEADRAPRELSGQVEQARRRLLREYRDILRERPSRNDFT